MFLSWMSNSILLFFTSGRLPDGGQVVTIERDVERADRHFGLLDAAQDFGQALRQRHAAAHDADQSEVGDSVVFLHDLVGQPNQGALDFGSGEDLRFFAKIGRGGGGFGHAARIIRKAEPNEQMRAGSMGPITGIRAVCQTSKRPALRPPP